jgi:hypothetical protein
VIVVVRGELADGLEAAVVTELLDRARFHAPRVASFGANRGYAAKEVWEEAERRGLLAYVPLMRNQVPRSGQALALADKARCKSAAGIRAHAHRLADAEGAIAELKCCRSPARARRRGQAAFHEQLLIADAPLDLRKLARWRPLADSGVAERIMHACGTRPAIAADAALASTAADRRAPLAHQTTMVTLRSN